MRTYDTKRGFSTGMSSEQRHHEVMESIETKRISGKRKQRRWVAANYFKNYVYLDYVLKIGDTLCPVVKSMTISEAFGENKKYELEFLDDKKPRLYRWELLDPKKVLADRRELESFYMDFGHSGFAEAARLKGYKTR